MNSKKAISLFVLSAVSLTAVGCGISSNQIDLGSLPSDDVSAYASNGPKSGDIVPGEFIIKYKKTATNAITLLNSVGAQKVKDLSSGAQLIKLSSPQTNGSTVLNSLKSNPSVEWVEANRYITVPRIIKDSFVKLDEPAVDEFPNDPMFAQQYAHKVSQSVKGWELAKQNSKKVVTLAIIDTGIDGTHPDLKAKLGKGYDAYGKGQEYSDKQGHGTHCAGIASAITNNGVGVAGYAPDAKLVSVKVLGDNGSGTYAAVADGIAWAAKNPDVDVMSMSLGGPSASQAITDAVNLATANGKLLIAAMGNDGNANLSYPAAIKGVLAVGATDSGDKIASFSQFGPHISVSAPGVNILSTFPMYQSGMPAKEYGKISGTSMACPGVAGLAALVKSVNPNLKPDQLKEVLQKSTDDLGDKGFDIHYGFGRINTFKAIQEAIKSR